MERAIKAVHCHLIKYYLLDRLAFTVRLKWNRNWALKTKPEDLSCLKNIVEKHAGDEKFETMEK